VATSHATPDSVLQRLGRHVDPEVQQAANRLRDVRQAAASERAREDLMMASINQELPPDFLAALASHPAGFDGSLIGNPSLPDSSRRQVLARLSHSDNPYRRVEAALSRFAPDSMLDRLSGDTSSSVRVVVARNDHTPVAAIRRLARDPIDTVRVALLLNRHTPPDVLAALQRDTAEVVELAVADDSRTPGDILGALARSSRPRVRAIALANARTPAPHP
jgi:hypothetical protein